MLSVGCISKAATLLIVVQALFIRKGYASSKDDKITALPGQPPVKFNQYAGYIAVGDMEQRFLFYYFVEAETSPQTKPLVLWFSGGPGCSSVGGGFFGLGPFLPKGEVLLKNNFSWNQEANMLFVDFPAGVGFSYSPNKSFYNFTNDAITAQDNLNFLFGWLEKYPEYKTRDIFISGVSYAGHFVPQLANIILDTRLKSNLKGILIGNPLLYSDIDDNAQGDFYWSHGLISDSTYSMLNKICNISQINRQKMEGNISPACLQVYNQAVEEIGNFMYIEDVVHNLCLSESSTQGGCKDGYATILFEVPKYLNRKDVQQALHAKLVGVNQWSLCIDSSEIGYDPKDSSVSMLHLLGKLVEEGVRVMVFSGDQDGNIPFIGTRRLVGALAEHLGLSITVPYRSWLEDKQVGGWTQVYGNILSFATVRGGGHISLLSQPGRTFLLFNTFLEGKPLPLAPAN